MSHAAQPGAHPAPPSPGRGIDAHRLRRLMADVCSPVAIVTTRAQDEPHGSTVSSLAVLSMEPPLLTVAFARTSGLLRRITDAGRFGVNLLSHRQAGLAALFARPGVDRFRDTGWRYDDGLPRLDGCTGWAACDLYQTVPGGDHLLLFGLVTSTARTELPPLIYSRRTFGTHSRFADRPRRPIVDQISACAR